MRKQLIVSWQVLIVENPNESDYCTLRKLGDYMKKAGRSGHLKVRIKQRVWATNQNPTLRTS